MNVLVCIKRVLALDDEIVFTEDGLDVDHSYLEGSLNEWDGFAIEEGLRLREAHGGEVVVATCGDSSAESVLRRGLAMGADRALRVECGGSDPFSVGAALGTIADALRPDLILCGAQSSDSAQAATGTAIAGILNLPCVALAKSIQADPSTQTAIVDCELEGGVVNRVRMTLPAVVSVQTGINQPRYANLRAIKQAERETIETLTANTINPAYRVRRMYVPSRDGHAQALGLDLPEAASTLARLIRERVA